MELVFREVTIRDLKLLLTWRNDPITRQNSMNTEPIAEKDHEVWLKNQLKNQNQKLYIAEISGAPIGTIRLDLHDSEWELSWTVAPSVRGKGFGKKMVKAATELVSEDLIAKVKSGNTPSIQIAEYAGFTPVGHSDGLIMFRLSR